MNFILKPGVRLQNLSPQLVLALLVVRDVFANHDTDCVVTSCNDSTHGYTSLHNAGHAADIRSKTLGTTPAKLAVRDIVRARLGSPDFDFILEDVDLANEHFHLEWQPKTPV